MTTIRIHPADAEKYGAPEVIEFDWSAIGIRQRGAAEKAFKRPWRWLIEQMNGVPELDDNLNPVLHTDPVTGEPILIDGEPVMRITRDGEAVAMLVWMALWGIGIKVPAADFDVRQNGLFINDTESEEPEEEAQGKEPAAETDSESTTTS